MFLGFHLFGVSTIRCFNLRCFNEDPQQMMNTSTVNYCVKHWATLLTFDWLLYYSFTCVTLTRHNKKHILFLLVLFDSQGTSPRPIKSRPRPVPSTVWAQNCSPYYFRWPFWNLNRKVEQDQIIISLELQNTRLEVVRRSFKHRVVKYWNRLTEDIVNASSLNVFKNQLDEYTLNI